MKLSQFEGGMLLKFVNGVLEKVRNNSKINGDIEFYPITKKIINEIEELGNKDLNDIEFTFRVIPILSNMELDVTLECFKNMITIPTKQFSIFLSTIFDIMDDFKESTLTMNDIINKANKLSEGIPVVEPITEPIKTKNEILEELYVQLSEFKNDKTKRLEVLAKINELESEQ